MWLFCWESMGGRSNWISWKHPLFLCQSDSVKAPPAPVPWIKVSQNKETYERKVENEEISLLDRVGSPSYYLSSSNAAPSSFALITSAHQRNTAMMKLLDRHDVDLWFNQYAQELSELRLGVEQVTERELEMAKRLEDFIVQSQDQNAVLSAEVNELRDLLAVREEQLASATFRWDSGVGGTDRNVIKLHSQPFKWMRVYLVWRWTKMQLLIGVIGWGLSRRRGRRMRGSWTSPWQQLSEWTYW